MTMAVNRNTAYSFGGVFDECENEEEISSSRFYNDLYTLDLEKLVWRDVAVTGKKDKDASKPRRRKNEAKDEGR